MPLSDDQCRRIATILGIQPNESLDWVEAQSSTSNKPTLREKFEAIKVIMDE